MKLNCAIVGSQDVYYFLEILLDLQGEDGLVDLGGEGVQGLQGHDPLVFAWQVERIEEEEEDLLEVLLLDLPWASREELVKVQREEEAESAPNNWGLLLLVKESGNVCHDEVVQDFHLLRSLHQLVADD